MVIFIHYGVLVGFLIKNMLAPVGGPININKLVITITHMTNKTIIMSLKYINSYFLGKNNIKTFITDSSADLNINVSTNYNNISNKSQVPMSNNNKSKEALDNNNMNNMKNINNNINDMNNNINDMNNMSNDHINNNQFSNIDNNNNHKAPGAINDNNNNNINHKAPGAMNDNNDNNDNNNNKNNNKKNKNKQDNKLLKELINKLFKSKDYINYNKFMDNYGLSCFIIVFKLLNLSVSKDYIKDNYDIIQNILVKIKTKSYKSNTNSALESEAELEIININ